MGIPPVPSTALLENLAASGGRTAAAPIHPAELQSMQSQNALRAQETSGLVQEQAIKQQALRDNDVIRRAYINTSGDPNEVRDYAIKNGISGSGLMGWQQHAYDLQQKAALLKQTDIANKTNQFDLQMKGVNQAGTLMEGINAVADPEQQKALYAQNYPALQAADPGEHWVTPDQFTPEMGKYYLGATGHAKAVMDRVKAQAEVGASNAQAAAATAQAGLHTTEASIKQKQLDAMNAAATAGGPERYAFIDKQIDPAKHPDLNQGARAAYDSMLKAGAAPEDAVKSVAAFATHAAQRDTEQDPGILSARRTSAIIEAKALREGDNPSLAGVPPAAASSAVSAATKLDADYIKAKEATEAMGRMLDLADRGNVAAGANIPMVGVAGANAINGIKRINSAEIAQYGSAGSLLQKIQGKLQGWTEGQPIPASVRDDIRELHQQLGEGAWKQYTSGLDSLNKRTGAKFGPTQEPPNIRKAGAQAAQSVPPAVQNVLKGAGPGIHTLSDGTKWMKAADGTITAQ